MGKLLGVAAGALLILPPAFLLGQIAYDELAWKRLERRARGVGPSPRPLNGRAVGGDPGRLRPTW